MEEETEHRCEKNTEECLKITEEDGKWWLEQEFYDSPTYLLQVNYCPFCGKKLR